MMVAAHCSPTSATCNDIVPKCSAYFSHVNSFISAALTACSLTLQQVVICILWVWHGKAGCGISWACISWAWHDRIRAWQQGVATQQRSASTRCLTKHSVVTSGCGTTLTGRGISATLQQGVATLQQGVATLRQGVEGRLYNILPPLISHVLMTSNPTQL